MSKISDKQWENIYKICTKMYNLIKTGDFVYNYFGKQINKIVFTHFTNEIIFFNEDTEKFGGDKFLRLDSINKEMTFEQIEKIMRLMTIEQIHSINDDLLIVKEDKNIFID